MSRWGFAVAVALATLPAVGCAGANPDVSVLYAGSLVPVMEHRIGPGFAHSSGDGYQGYGAGSTEIASEVASGTRSGDVFISASPTADRQLRADAQVRWWAGFATAPLVIAYNPHSRFAAAFRTRPWYDVVTTPGLRLGRTDPALDPKGALTVQALQAAQRVYHLPGFARRVSAAAQVFPEEDLVGRLTSGQLDAGFFYSNEAAAVGLPTVGLGRVHAAARFTVTILDHASHPVAAARFVRYLLAAARSTLAAAGLRLHPPRLTGPVTAVPVSLRPLLTG